MMEMINSAEKIEIENIRSKIVGIDQKVPLLDRRMQTYVFLDNAASTPSFIKVQEKVNELLQFYASIHRGTGFKSLLSTYAYEEARNAVIRFVGADPEFDVAIFGKNTTEATNTLANCIEWKNDDVVIVTLMEHHSNDLPWRKHAAVKHFGVQPDGSFDLVRFDSILQEHKGHVRIVAVTGASNVTGTIPPYYEIAELAHKHGALILLDCAQLAPHRSINVKPHGTPDHIDFVCLSAHKMYAPFGTGVLIGPREFFNKAQPVMCGGGTIEVVTVDNVVWADAPEKFEAGSPNVIGAVALGASICELTSIGMDNIAAHEKELTTYLLNKLNKIADVRIFGANDVTRLENKVGVIPFEIKGIPHGKVSAILSFEGGVGVRSGCFCAHPFLINLLNITRTEFLEFEHQVLRGDRRKQPGMVRASFGCYTSLEDLDTLVMWIERIIAGDYSGKYKQEISSGSFLPSGYDPGFLNKFFSLD